MIPRKLSTAVLVILTLCAMSFSALGQTERAGASPPSQLQLATVDAGTHQVALSQGQEEGLVPATQEFPKVKVKEALPNGEFIVLVDGVEQRTLTREHAERIRSDQFELDKCKRARGVIDKQIALYESTMVLLKKDRDLADTQAQLESERARRIETMYNSEYALRLRAEALNNAHSKKPWPFKVFDSPYVKLVFDVGVPTVNLVRAYRN